jgi:hypothetical protein
MPPLITLLGSGYDIRLISGGPPLTDVFLFASQGLPRQNCVTGLSCVHVNVLWHAHLLGHWCGCDRARLRVPDYFVD